MPAPWNGHGSGNGHGNGHGRSWTPPTPAPAPTDRTPPQNIEAEQGVLGSVLLDNDMLHEIIPILKVQDFYRDNHQTIFRAIRDLYNDTKAVDSITLIEELNRRGEFEKIG